jgi:hypothetical protein
MFASVIRSRTLVRQFWGSGWLRRGRTGVVSGKILFSVVPGVSVRFAQEMNGGPDLSLRNRAPLGFLGYARLRRNCRMLSASPHHGNSRPRRC